MFPKVQFPALLVSATLALCGCSKTTDSSQAAQSADTRSKLNEPAEIRVSYLYVQDSAGATRGAPAGAAAGTKTPLESDAPETHIKGGSGEARVRIGPNKKHDVQVSISEECFDCSGPEWRAAVWMAAVLSTSTLDKLLTDYEFTVFTPGRIEGPSAGALLTAAMMAVLRGVNTEDKKEDKAKDRPAITGTVNPDGTIGPVEGIPQKLLAAAAAEKTLFCYPIGQRNAWDDNLKREVDIEQLAASKDMKTKAMRDIYDAYECLTGDRIPHSAAVSKEEMEHSFDRMQRIIERWLDDARSTASETQNRVREARHPVHDLCREMYDSSLSAYEHARQSLQQRMLPIAYHKALQSRAWGQVSRYCVMLGVQDDDDLARETEDVGNVEREWLAFQDELSSGKPRSVENAINLIMAHAWAAKSRALLENSKPRLKEDHRRTTATPDGKPGLSLFQLFLARLHLTRGSDIFASDQPPGTGTPYKPDDVLIARLARSYASAAKASFHYAESRCGELSRAAPLADTSKKRAPRANSQDDENRNVEPCRISLVRDQVEYAQKRREEKGLHSSLAALGASIEAYTMASVRLAQLNVDSSRTHPTSSGSKTNHASSNRNTALDRTLINMLDTADVRAREAAAVAKAKAGFIPLPAKFMYQLASALREEGDRYQALYHFFYSSVLSNLAVQILPRPEGKPAVATK